MGYHLEDRSHSTVDWSCTSIPISFLQKDSFSCFIVVYVLRYGIDMQSKARIFKSPG